MALSKSLKLDSGITVKYHRITGISTATNVQSTISVDSYLNESARQKQKSGDENIFIASFTAILPYTPDLTIIGAYEWLKANTTEFSNATDVLEDSDAEQ